MKRNASGGGRRMRMKVTFLVGSLLACAVYMWAALTFTDAQTGQMHYCPLDAGTWSIAVWEGEDQVDTAVALDTCEQPIAAAYWLHPLAQTWMRWFPEQPAVSDLQKLDSYMGVFAMTAPQSELPPPVTPTFTPPPAVLPTEPPTSQPTEEPPALTETPTATLEATPTPEPLDLTQSGHCTAGALTQPSFYLHAGEALLSVQLWAATRASAFSINGPGISWGVLQLAAGDYVEGSAELSIPTEGNWTVSFFCTAADWSVRMQQ